MRVVGPPGSACMVCGTDLWDVERYVSAGAVVICQPCIDALKAALDQAEGTGKTEVTLPPKVHGPAPDDQSPSAVAEAFVHTFGSGAEVSENYVEDAVEVADLLAQAGGRFGPMTQFTVRVDAIRFPVPDAAEVRFQILMNAGPSGFPFQGTARRRDGKWRVTRETVAQVVGRAGVTVPPRGGMR